MNATRSILCLNAGSSSLKHALYRHRAGRPVRLRGGCTEFPGTDPVHGIEEAVIALMEELAPDLEGRPDAVGHRVVHGGAHFTKPVLIDDNGIALLRETIHLAPAHQPRSLAGIEAIRRLDPDLPQVACFDTAFHQSMPEHAKRFALPDEFWEAGIRRYGFHGLSYEHVCRVLEPDLPARTIIAHLGNGSSLVALENGRPVETTMGFTPNSGLVMGSRCGDLEPGVVLHLLRDGRNDVDSLDALLNEHSGLKGLSSLSSDMRRLLAEDGTHEGARRAIECFCYSACKHIGSLAAVLGGLDLLVFTGGIGENAPAIRSRIVDSLRRYLDFEDRVVPTDEELEVAHHTSAVCGLHPDL